MKHITEALSDLNAWEKFYFMVTGNEIFSDYPDFKDTPKDRKKSLEAFMRTHPGKISWKDLAEAAFNCGEEKVLAKLHHFMKSPDGNIIMSVTLIMKGTKGKPLVSFVVPEYACVKLSTVYEQSNYMLFLTMSCTNMG